MKLKNSKFKIQNKRKEECYFQNKPKNHDRIYVNLQNIHYKTKELVFISFYHKTFK